MSIFGTGSLRWHGHPARANSWPRWPCHFKLKQRPIFGSGSLRYEGWKWIPALRQAQGKLFAGMTMPRTGASNIVIPVKAGIHCPRSGVAQTSPFMSASRYVAPPSRAPGVHEKRINRMSSAVGAHGATVQWGRRHTRQCLRHRLHDRSLHPSAMFVRRWSIPRRSRWGRPTAPTSAITAREKLWLPQPHVLTIPNREGAPCPRP
jgi:hypothetical protein